MQRGQPEPAVDGAVAVVVRREEARAGGAPPRARDAPLGLVGSLGTTTSKSRLPSPRSMAASNSPALQVDQVRSAQAWVPWGGRRCSRPVSRPDRVDHHTGLLAVDALGEGGVVARTRRPGPVPASPAVSRWARVRRVSCASQGTCRRRAGVGADLVPVGRREHAQLEVGETRLDTVQHSERLALLVCAHCPGRRLARLVEGVLHRTREPEHPVRRVAARRFGLVSIGHGTNLGATIDAFRTYFPAVRGTSCRHSADILACGRCPMTP